VAQHGLGVGAVQHRKVRVPFAGVQGETERLRGEAGAAHPQEEYVFDPFVAQRGSQILYLGQRLFGLLGAP
jgi:hypothetical protein